MTAARFIKYHLPFWFWLVLIFIMSSIPGDKLPDETFNLNDKLIHFFVFLILYVTASYSFYNQSKFSLMKKHFYAAGFILAVLYGISDELHQYFVPLRSCEFYDLLADAAGAAAGMLVVYFTFYKRKFICSIKND